MIKLRKERNETIRHFSFAFESCPRFVLSRNPFLATEQSSPPADAGRMSCMNCGQSLAGSGIWLYRALINTGLEMDELALQKRGLY